MYSQSSNSSSMAPPQKPETFMLSNEAQQSLPQDAQVALQQVDNREYLIHTPTLRHGIPESSILIDCSQILPHLGTR